MRNIFKMLCSGLKKDKTSCTRKARVEGMCNQHHKMYNKASVIPVITITFGDVAENHVRNQQIGTLADRGFSIAELEGAQKDLEKLGATCELIDLREYLPDEFKDTCPEAKVLVVRQGITILLQDSGLSLDDLFREHKDLNWDKKAFMKGKVCNKLARHNLCYSDVAQEPCYEEAKGRIIAFDSVPGLSHIRKTLPTFLGEAGRELQAESNLYYDPSKCGIGMHGDFERRKVVALRLGARMPLNYQWFQFSKPIGKRVEIFLDSGDFYIMSEKAVGSDWLQKKIVTLRHAAGCEKYLTIK